MVPQTAIGLIGFGEVGGLFGAALVRAAAGPVFMFDRLLGDPQARDAMRQRARDRGVAVAETLADLLGHCDIVISAVTASQALDVARAASASVGKGAHFLDVNSASPRTKMACGAAIDGAGGRYVEAAVMAPVAPYGLRVPMLLGGPHAEGFAPTLAALGFDAKPGPARLGAVSAIKMCRSVMVKGLEAITVECLVAARAYGVEGPVLASLAESFPQWDWERQADYFFERVACHGRRRAEEMLEAAQTVREIGLDGCMAEASAGRQRWMASLDAGAAFTAAGSDWRSRADAALACLPPKQQQGTKDHDQ